jgi:flagellum-specific peptidoglycan hydrolase FlgJ
VYDYKAWQMQCAHLIMDEENYYKLLGERYAQDPEYVAKLKEIVSTK